MTDAVADPIVNPSQVSTPAAVSTPAIDAAAQAAIAEAVKAGLASKEDVSADAVTPVTYDDVGDPAMNLALSFVGKLGIPATHPAMIAAEAGSFDQLKGMFAAMGDKAKGWEQYVSIAEKYVAGTIESATAQTTAINNAIYGAAGGSAEEWAKVAAWAKSVAEPHEIKSLNKMLREDPVQARIAAASIYAQYTARSGAVVEPKSATRKGAGAVEKTVEGPINRRQLIKEVETLRREVGPNFQSDPRYAALHARVR